VSWATRISVEAKAYKYESTNAPVGQFVASPGLSFDFLKDYTWHPQSGAVGFGSTEIPNFVVSTETNPTQSPLLGSFSKLSGLSSGIGMPEKVLLKSGKTTFEIVWTATVRSTGKLSAPKIDSLKFVETAWE
jgi:hypothetical protein